MSFTDKQTLRDLNLDGKYRKDSVFSIFNATHTRKGEALLQKIFENPLTSAQDINRRSEILRGYAATPIDFPFTEEELEEAEAHSDSLPGISVLKLKARETLSGEKCYTEAKSGFLALCRILSKFHAFLKDAPKGIPELEEEKARFFEALPEEPMSEIERLSKSDVESLTLKEFSSGEKILKSLSGFLGEVFGFIYSMDVFLAVGKVAREKRFNFAVAHEGDGRVEIALKGVRHPALSGAVPNDFHMNSGENVFFLTGVNMAGKSTLMKSVSISVFLAHTGLPVPAESMDFTPLDGLFTSINISDNLSLGYSHFYAEAMRVKEAAEAVAEGMRMFVVFDELFKGTNVKDAYDATLAVIKAFSTHKKSLFLISTHIVEVGEALKESADGIQYGCLTSVLVSGVPTYSYKLSEGISSDRQGMDIIRGEHILEALKEAADEETTDGEEGFLTDSQTVGDLGLFGSKSDHGVFSLFNRTVTAGGARLLEEIFRKPVSGRESILKRQRMTGYFMKGGHAPEFIPSDFSSAEFYLSDKDPRTELDSDHKGGLRLLAKEDSERKALTDGFESLKRILAMARVFCGRVISDEGDSPVASESRRILSIIEKYDLKDVTDKRLRFEDGDKMAEVMRFLYSLDAFSSVARISLENGYSMPEVLSKSENVLEIKGLHHPLLEKPVANDLSVGGDKNVLFLTGANMAGKSTLMKATGICVYLAHLGFPVPAESMRFSPRNGLYTTINLSDNLSQGFSHFYSEVRRLRKTASAVGKHRRMVVIFDELFRGTNVKDAYDGTVAMVEAFSGVRDSAFIVSTHVTEAGEELGKKCGGRIKYQYLPSALKDGKPVYTYRLADGITSDRFGMTIIRNEHILDIL